LAIKSEVLFFPVCRVGFLLLASASVFSAGGNCLVQICFALDDFRLLLFLMCQILQVLTPVICVIDFSYRDPEGEEVQDLWATRVLLVEVRIYFELLSASYFS
jgi:hypothetical protein